jgi:phytoene dehydrogenase-like protein
MQAAGFLMSSKLAELVMHHDSQLCPHCTSQHSTANHSTATAGSQQLSSPYQLIHKKKRQQREELANQYAAALRKKEKELAATAHTLDLLPVKVSRLL